MIQLTLHYRLLHTRRERRLEGAYEFVELAKRRSILRIEGFQSARQLGTVRWQDCGVSSVSKGLEPQVEILDSRYEHRTLGKHDEWIDLVLLVYRKDVPIVRPLTGGRKYQDLWVNQ